MTRFLTLFSCLLTWILTLSSETTSRVVRLNYDENGNRTVRMLYTPNSMPEKQKTAPRHVTSNISLFDGSIKIGPNPTSGIIRIEATGYNEQQQTLVYIHKTSGQMILTEKISGPVTELNISDEVNGIYIVNVVTDDNCVSCKIIKQ